MKLFEDDLPAADKFKLQIQFLVGWFSVFIPILILIWMKFIVRFRFEDLRKSRAEFQRLRREIRALFFSVEITSR